MVGASIEFKRLLLRGIGWDAQKAQVRLREALQSACQARLEENRSGLVLIGTKGNGAELTFGVPQMATLLTPSTICETVSQLYDLYEATVAELGVDEVTADDSAILARMLKLLISRNCAYTDRSSVRSWPTQFAA